jgi:hypothetical protein
MAFDGPSEGLALQMSPSTWGAFEGFPLEYWEDGFDGTAQEVAGSS